MRLPFAVIVAKLNEKTAVRVARDDWRHGTIDTFKIEHEGKPYLVELRNDTQEGIDRASNDTEIEILPAKQIQVPTWVAE